MNLLNEGMEIPIEFDQEPTKGSNFLVSAIMILRKQRKELTLEVERLKERLSILEHQNAGLLNVSADRLLEKRG